jgi:hypothetical protein
MSFWPDDIDSDEVRSPRDIMRDAGDELESRTGKLTAAVHETRLSDRVVLAFRVTNREFGLELTLFEVSHQFDHSYLVLIDPPANDIPSFLSRKRWVPGKPGTMQALMRSTSALSAFREFQGSPGHFVENKWVCATPSEFKEKLENLFSEDHVKWRILSLMAPNAVQQVAEEQSEENEALPPETNPDQE